VIQRNGFYAVLLRFLCPELDNNVVWKKSGFVAIIESWMILSPAKFVQIERDNAFSPRQLAPRAMLLSAVDRKDFRHCSKLSTQMRRL
jgi:hypothetical protein